MHYGMMFATGPMYQSEGSDSRTEEQSRDRPLHLVHNRNICQACQSPGAKFRVKSNLQETKAANKTDDCCKASAS
jgi:hypothetical protein